MRRRHVVGFVLIVAALFFAQLYPAFGQSTLMNAPVCTAAAIYDASTNGSTRMVAAPPPGTGAIYICDFTFFSGGIASVKLISGTGTNCGTGSANLTPAFPLTAQTGISGSSQIYRGLNVQPGNDLCINTSAGVAIQAIVYYGLR